MSLFTKQQKKTHPKGQRSPSFSWVSLGPITLLECALKLFSFCTRFWSASFISKVTRCENISSSRCKLKKYTDIRFIVVTLALGGLLKGALFEAHQNKNSTNFTSPRPCLDSISSLGPLLPTSQWYHIITVHKEQPWEQFGWLHHLFRSSGSTKLAYSWSVELQAPNTVNCSSFPFVSLVKCVILAL